MKNIMLAIGALICVLGGIGFVGCGDTSNDVILGNSDQDLTKPVQSQIGVLLPDASDLALSAGETATLVWMREEEKLARDVYVSLFEKWNLNVFKSISQSEQRHMDAVNLLLDRYGIEDPASLTSPGQFQNEELQKLYDDLIEQGNKTVGDAIKVGALIEEVDIDDLIRGIDATEHEDILWTYNNLIQGSNNHLRAFVRTLNQQVGETYLPQVLALADYEKIIDGQSGNGQRQGQRQGQARGQARGQGR